ncbi:MAG: methylmalonyl Co-A mutase-associated GTPase MeaB, partial [Flavobacterium sp.]|nr:methylmalonyl Co-A mutase-associated GTPase MeaB [Flavobacterium sp.]
PKVTTCSALTQEGIPDVWNTIEEYFTLTRENGYFHQKRKEQNQYWLLETINEQLKQNFYNHPDIQILLEENKKAVQNNEISPFAAAKLLLDNYFK